MEQVKEQDKGCSRGIVEREGRKDNRVERSRVFLCLGLTKGLTKRILLAREDKESRV